MNAHEFRFGSIALSAVALATITIVSLWTGLACAAGPDADAQPTNAPIVVAAAPGTAAKALANPESFPSSQAGVRAAAAEGPDALRRYTWRTRMIYNFRYADFAPKE